MEIKKVLLKNGQNCLGDSIMFTPLVRDLKTQYPEWEIKAQSCFPEIWENNPHITDFEGEPDVVYGVGPKIVTNGSKSNGLHFSNAFRVSLENNENWKEGAIRQGAFKPEIFLSKYEKKNRLIEGKYWVVNIDCGPYDTKRWPIERWQELVNQMKDITFVQVGSRQHNKERLTGSNVIDYVGKTENPDTGLRDLFTLFYHSEGAVSLISGSMHLAAALSKPCVVIAGAREPTTFEQYAWHQYITTVGSLPCAPMMACWACSKGKCDSNRARQNLPPGTHAPCMEIITVEDVKRGIESYYDGGLLTKTEGEKVMLAEPKVMKVVSNGKMLGGAERSMLEVIKMAQKEGYRVELATRGGPPCEAIEKKLNNVKITDDVSGPCDILLLYASDMIWDFHLPEFDVFNKVQAKRKIMALTYKVGSRIGKVPWTKGWDKYIFLSIDLATGFSEDVGLGFSEPNIVILPPPIDLEPFFKVEPDYYQSKHPRIMRHSSQGDLKYDPSINDIMGRSMYATFHLMPSPSFLDPELRGTNLRSYPYDFMPVPEFLAKGNCFWYLLPEGYTDQGPRVIMEAMAAGLPVIAENRDGAKDRVTPETGWLIDNHEEAVDIINSLTPEILEKKGEAARERARTEFRKERWIEEIIGDEESLRGVANG